MDLFDCDIEIKKVLGHIDLGLYKYPIYDISKKVDMFKPVDYIIPESYEMEISFEGRMEFEYLLFLLESFKTIPKCEYYEPLNSDFEGVFYNVGIMSIDISDSTKFEGFAYITYIAFLKTNNDNE